MDAEHEKKEQTGGTTVQTEQKAVQTEVQITTHQQVAMANLQKLLREKDEKLARLRECTAATACSCSEDLMNKILWQNARLKKILRGVVYGTDYLDKQEYEDRTAMLHDKPAKITIRRLTAAPLVRTHSV